MLLYRCFAWNERARDREADGPLWFPRPYQGEGRHDNPDVYGCLYLSDHALSSLVEQFARFRGQRLLASMLRRRGLPLALADVEFDDRAELVDLDNPVVLRRERLRPSRVATRQRSITQGQALQLYERHPHAAGLRWWSNYESLWTNVTVFGRGASHLHLRSVRPLSVDDPAVVEVADLFGLRALS